MSVDFKFAKLSIRNFRGIHELDVELPEGMPINLIGANNSGKSTVLDAFALVLKGGGMHAFVPERYDYYHDAQGNASGDFVITLYFSAAATQQLPAVQGVGNPIPVHGIRVLGSTDKNGRFSHQHVLIGDDDKTITFSTHTPLKGKAKEDFSEHGLGWRPMNARPQVIREHLPEVWLLRPDNVKASLYHWKTGPLQRLSKLLAEQFMGTPWSMDYQGTKRDMPQTMEKAHAFFRDAVSQFPFWIDDLKPKLESTLSEYVGRDAKIELRPDIQTLEEWLAQQLMVAFATDAGGATTPLERMGDGWQSLIRIASLDVLSQLPGQTKDRVVLLFEEPETNLHPHLARKLRGVLGGLANNGWIVMTSTHSPDLISFSVPQSVIRLWRKSDGVGKGELLTSTAGPEAKFQERLDERGGHEMLFARRVVLVEGKDDAFAIRLFLEKADLDLDGSSISIVRTGDVGTLPTYAELASKLHIPWFAITDEDPLPDGAIKKNTADARQKLAGLNDQSSESETWKTTLEACLGKKEGKARPDWIAEQLGEKTSDQIRTEHPDYASVCDSVITWLEAVPI